MANLLTPLMYRHICIGVLMALLINTSQPVQAQFNNVKLIEDNGLEYPPLEPSIAVNPKNKNNIVAGVVLNRVFYTTDGGNTWQSTKLTSPYGVYGDPAIIADKKGHFYYFHLADPSGKGRDHPEWLDMIVCQKSTDGGKTWSKGVAIGKNSPTDQDKEWPAVHPRKKHMVVTWTQFDTYGLSSPDCQSHIRFSQSYNGGKKWTSAISINQKPGDCKDDDQTVEGATSAIDHNDNIFVVWAYNEKIYMDRSYDEGKTWLDNDLVIADQVGGWSMDIPGIFRCNGMPVLQIDHSQSPFRNRLYVVWADQRKGTRDSDIWMTYSSRSGDYWTTPKRVNQDSTKSHQFFPWSTVDPVTGYVYVLYYDRRNHSGKLDTDVYMACSQDGGNTFLEWKINKTSFVPSSEVFFGDYLNISAYGGVIATIWTQMHNKKTSVWTSTIRHSSDLQ